MGPKLVRWAFVLAGAAISAAQTGPVVAITGGQIRGRLTANGGAAFKGIPYAAPPLADLRWREPQPVEPWQGVRDLAALKKAGWRRNSAWRARSSPRAGTAATSRAAARTACT